MLHFIALWLENGCRLHFQQQTAMRGWWEEARCRQWPVPLWLTRSDIDLMCLHVQDFSDIPKSKHFDYVIAKLVWIREISFYEIS